MDASDVRTVFSGDGYVVDEDKNLYALREDKRVFVQRLRKHIYRLVVYKGETYFIDSFGDCFAIRGGPVFMFGILGMPSFFEIQNDRIFVLDAYQRLWVHDLLGKLAAVVFVKAECGRIVLRDRFTVVFVKPEEDGAQDVLIKVFNEEHRLVLSRRVCEITEYQPTCFVFTSADGTFRFDVVDNKIEDL